MVQLTLRLLGPFAVTLNNDPIQLPYDKVAALLALLALPPRPSLHRDQLADLLWPDATHQDGRRNLSQALYQLRRALHDNGSAPPFLLATRTTIRLNPAAQMHLDIAAFGQAVAAGDWETAVAHYRGPFLAGFAAGASAEFEEWILTQRERFHREAVAALQAALHAQEAAGRLDQALDHAFRLVSLDTWREEAHQQLMRLLALTGQRTAALRQFETCRQILARELDVEPSDETRALFEQIRDGRFQPSPSAAAAKVPPSTPSSAAAPASTFIPRPQFVDKLDVVWSLVLQQQGQVAFVAGAPGSGKTLLLQAFTQHARQTTPRLVVAGGSGNAYTGLGDPYLLWREILDDLTGAGGRRHSAAWQLPLSLLLDVAPDVVGAFLDAGALLARSVAQPAAAQQRLQAFVDRRHIPAAPATQQALFGQMTRLLQMLAAHAPLLLLLDDLQWADAASLSLLFHLMHRLDGHAILLLGAYRPAEVALGRGDAQHPLQPVLHEAQLRSGRDAILLPESGDRAFAEALLDGEPNRFDGRFRQAFFDLTGGHPLFAVELLKGMREQGNLVQDDSGRWVSTRDLRWETLPPRVEAAIGQRIHRLPPALHALLATASVAGETFTAELLATIQAAPKATILQQLGSELERRYLLVQAQGISSVGQQRLSHFRFRHFLIQHYLYRRLSAAERSSLHEEVARALLQLHHADLTAVAPALAWHFEQAGLLPETVRYLQLAGETAVRRAANAEALTLFQHALTLLPQLPPGRAKDTAEMNLLMAMGPPTIALKGYAAPELQTGYGRARELCHLLFRDDPQALFPLLYLLWNYYFLHADYAPALNAGREMLAIGEALDDPVRRALGHQAAGTILMYTGDIAAARRHLHRAGDRYEPGDFEAWMHRSGQDPGVVALAYCGKALTLLGHVRRGLAYARRAVAAADATGHLHTMIVGRVLGPMRNLMIQRDYGEMLRMLADIRALAEPNGFDWWANTCDIFEGWVRAMQGNPADARAGLDQMVGPLQLFWASGARHNTSQFYLMWGGACLRAGLLDEGLVHVAEGLTAVAGLNERYLEPELYRLRGELRWQQGAPAAEVAADFERAIAGAREQQAKIYELRATVRLARWAQAHGNIETALPRLQAIYAWFEPGLALLDVQDAAALLPNGRGTTA